MCRGRARAPHGAVVCSGRASERRRAAAAARVAHRPRDADAVGRRRRAPELVDQHQRALSGVGDYARRLWGGNGEGVRLWARRAKRKRTPQSMYVLARWLPGGPLAIDDCAARARTRHLDHEGGRVGLDAVRRADAREHAVKGAARARGGWPRLLVALFAWLRLHMRRKPCMSCPLARRGPLAPPPKAHVMDMKLAGT